MDKELNKMIAKVIINEIMPLHKKYKRLPNPKYLAELCLLKYYGAITYRHLKEYIKQTDMCSVYLDKTYVFTCEKCGEIKQENGGRDRIGSDNSLG